MICAERNTGTILVKLLKHNLVTSLFVGVRAVKVQM